MTAAAVQYITKTTTVPVYPWTTMERGDHFFVPNGNRGSLSAMCWGKGKGSGNKRFSTSSDQQNGVTGIRVTRTR